MFDRKNTLNKDYKLIFATELLMKGRMWNAWANVFDFWTTYVRNNCIFL